MSNAMSTFILFPNNIIVIVPPCRSHLTFVFLCTSPHRIKSFLNPIYPFLCMYQQTQSAPLGTWLATTGCHLLTGGGRGVMELVSKTFSEVEGREGSIIGVVPALPGSQHGNVSSLFMYMCGYSCTYTLSLSHTFIILRNMYNHDV